MEAFRECGSAAFVIMSLVALSTIMALSGYAVAFAKPRVGIVLGALGLVFAFITPVVGVVGTAMGRAKVELALKSGVAPEFADRLRQQGYAEASQCTQIGAFGSGLPLILSVGATLFSFVRRQTEKPDP